MKIEGVLLKKIVLMSPPCNVIFRIREIMVIIYITHPQTGSRGHEVGGEVEAAVNGQHQVRDLYEEGDKLKI